MIKENERLDIIQSKGYAIIQNKNWFSYGIDAVLLSAFVTTEAGQKIIDLGTGTGIIPMLLFLKNNDVEIIGVEKQKEVAEMANRSIVYNQISNIKILNADILELESKYKKGSIDIVVSNPPYFQKGDGLINNESIKAISRHETTANLESFIKTSATLLRDKGCFYMVHRPMRLVDIFYYCRKYKLEPKEIQYVYPNTSKPPNIVLIKCVKNGNVELKYIDNLYVYDDNKQYTEEIKTIYKSLNIDVF